MTICFHNQALSFNLDFATAKHAKIKRAHYLSQSPSIACKHNNFYTNEFRRCVQQQQQPTKNNKPSTIVNNNKFVEYTKQVQYAYARYTHKYENCAFVHRCRSLFRAHSQSPYPSFSVFEWYQNLVRK